MGKAHRIKKIGEREMVVYEPKGKAREYSPLALNVYLGCSHKCKYCYANRMAKMNGNENYFCVPEPRKGLMDKLHKELKNAPKQQVLLSFIGDPYCETMDDNRLTREALAALEEAKSPVAVLTKGGTRCLKDLDMFKKFGEHIQVGATLTFSNPEDSAEWESGAASPSDRIEALKVLHSAGVRTFASFEPVIDPAQSIQLIKDTIEFVDVYKVGKINNYKGIDKAIDWESFLRQAVDILRSNGKRFYIKHDLRNAAPNVRLYGNECLSDEHNVM